MRSFLRSAFVGLSSFAALSAFVSGQSSLSPVNTVCTTAPTCPTNPTAVPPAWFNLTFPSNPSTVTGAASTNFGWEASDAGDAACGFQHQGILTVNASLSQYVDLNTATGVNSAGYALPGYIGGPGAGSLAAGTMGWTFESTVRINPNLGNSKIAAIGSGAPLYNIFLSNDGTANAGMNFGLYDGNTVAAIDYTDGHAGIIELVTPYVQYQWYHFVAVLQQVTTSNLQENNVTHGAWFIYVNGNLLNYPGGVAQNNILPPAVPRPFAYLGKSDWNDPYWSGLIDTFRIYNYALSASQVSTLYAGEMGGCAVPISTAVPASVSPNLLPRNATGPVTPYFSATFNTDPLQSVPGAQGYGWVPSLTSDSAYNQSLRTGLLTLVGADNQYVNLALASGANSIGQVLGPIGGGSAGWSFEIMVQPYSGADGWSKVYDLGSTRNPNPLNDIVLGWDGSAAAPDSFWQFDVADNTTAGNQFQTGDAIGEIAYSVWSHVVAVITPTANGNANYLIYLNGQLYTTVTNAFYPVSATRQNLYIGKSGWSDPYFSGAVDFFNVYSQSLSDAQVAGLYAAAMQPPVAPSSGGAAASTGGAPTGASGSTLPYVNTICSAVPGCIASPTPVPPAWYNLTFPVNPATISGAATTNFGWEAATIEDQYCNFQHKGVLTLNSTFSQYVDMNTATGANSVGYTLPGLIGGPGAGSMAAGTQGWSFEATVRVNPNLANAKIVSIGSGAPLNNIFLSNDGTTNGGLNFGLYDSNTVASVDYSDGHSGIIELVNPYIQYQWYHFVAVLQQVAPVSRLENNVTHGAWFLYVNGNLLNFSGGVTQNNMLPTALARSLAYLGKSDWNDPYWSGMIDTFRIYNYALTGAQVGTLYAGEMGGCPVPVSTTAPTVATPNILPRTATGAVTPFFSATFNTNPLLSVAGASTYNWTNTLATDNSANQAIHQGLLTFNGTGQYVNLYSATGAASIGQALPTFGGGSTGWSFEIMFLANSGADSWPKVMDLGTTRVASGTPLNDIVLGWDGNAGAPDSFWQFEVADNGTQGYNWGTGDALGEVNYNTWIHAVAVIAPSGVANTANYFIYYNGQLYTTVTNAFYPVAVPRQNSYLGKSGWSDPGFNGAVDFFNVYSTALSDGQIAALYQPYVVAAAPSSTAPAVTPTSAPSATSAASPTTTPTPSATPSTAATSPVPPVSYTSTRSSTAAPGIFTSSYVAPTAGPNPATSAAPVLTSSPVVNPPPAGSGASAQTSTSLFVSVAALLVAALALLL